MAQNSAAAAADQASEIAQGSSNNAYEAAQAEAIVKGVINAANNAAAIAALIPLQRSLRTNTGPTRTQCAAVATDGYEYFMEFEIMQWYSIEKLIFTAKNSNLNRGGLSVSDAMYKGIQALAFWVNDSLRIVRVVQRRLL